MGVLKRFGDRPAGDLVEDDPLNLLWIEVQCLDQVPGDGLPLAVTVSREIDLRRGAGELAELTHDASAAADNLISRLEV